MFVVKTRAICEYQQETEQLRATMKVIGRLTVENS